MVLHLPVIVELSLQYAGRFDLHTAIARESTRVKLGRLVWFGFVICKAAPRGRIDVPHLGLDAGPLVSNYLKK